MTTERLWNEQLRRLRTLALLADKPEETVAATLKALWSTASGNPMSAEKAVGCELPCLDVEEEKTLTELVDDRLAGTPLAHITGFQQFMGVELLAGPEALIPRKETEILGRQVLNLLCRLAAQQNKIVLMDVCTGAGNLIVALTAKVPAIQGYAADLSADAVRLAQKNVIRQKLQDRVEVLQGDLLSPFDNENFHHQVDVLLCNPPYISSGRVAEMAREISDHEPRLAFDGGPFGIKILNSLIKQAPRFLRSGGWLAFEVGSGQGAAFVKRMEKTYSNVQTAGDKNGEIRVVTGQLLS